MGGAALGSVGAALIGYKILCFVGGAGSAVGTQQAGEQDAGCLRPYIRFAFNTLTSALTGYIKADDKYYDYCRLSVHPLILVFACLHHSHSALFCSTVMWSHWHK